MKPWLCPKKTSFLSPNPANSGVGNRLVAPVARLRATLARRLTARLMTVLRGVGTGGRGCRDRGSGVGGVGARPVNDPGRLWSLWPTNYYRRLSAAPAADVCWSEIRPRPVGRRRWLVGGQQARHNRHQRHHWRHQRTITPSSLHNNAAIVTHNRRHHRHRQLGRQTGTATEPGGIF